MKKTLGIAVITILLLTLDMVSKYFFYNKSYLSDIRIIEPILNKWISRWINVNMTIIIIISIISLFLFIFLYHRKFFWTKILSLLIAGTLWNLIDRIYLWWVRDFISISSFPIFNISDVLLNIWIISIILKEFFVEKIKEKIKLQ